MIKRETKLESSFVRDVYFLPVESKLVFVLNGGEEYAYPVKGIQALDEFHKNANRRGSLGEEYNTFIRYYPTPGEKLCR